MKTILYIGSNTCTTLYGPIILWELLYRGWSSRNFMHEGVATCRAVTDWQLCKTICLIAWAPWKGYINMLKFCLHGDSMSLQMKRPSSEWHLSWMYYTMLNNYVINQHSCMSLSYMLHAWTKSQFIRWRPWLETISVFDSRCVLWSCKIIAHVFISYMKRNQEVGDTHPIHPLWISLWLAI